MFRRLQTNSPETCREVGLRVLCTDVQYCDVISFLGWKSGQQEEGYYAPKLFRTQTREIKTSDYFYRILRIRLCANIATQFKSCDDSFARLQLFCLSILSCNKLHVTNCTIITSRMNHQMFWIVWQQGSWWKHVCRIRLLMLRFDYTLRGGS